MRSHRHAICCSARVRIWGTERILRHVAARVMAQSGTNEVFVFRVVTDLVARAGLQFAKRGSFDLKGIPRSWELFSAVQ
jgi:hypothetical protein